MILVVGASSKPGQKLVPMLAEKGYQVRAMTRDSRKLNFANFPGVEVFEGDLRQPDSINRACEGAEVIVSSVTAILKTGDNDIQVVDNMGNRLLVDAAKRLGVKRFVFVSAFGAASSHSLDLFRVKDDVEEYIKSSRIPHTILRPTSFMETWCAPIGGQVTSSKKATVWGNGKNPISFISTEDVARFIVIALEDFRLSNKTLTIGGPQNLTFDEVVDAFERITRKKSIRRYVSAAQLRLLGRFYDFFDETKARLFKMRYELATSNWQVDMSETLKSYPINLKSLNGYMEDYRNG
jgi:uncharacterized protein YbjT (DUF2867 family)